MKMTLRLILAAASTMALLAASAEAETSHHSRFPPSGEISRTARSQAHGSAFRRGNSLHNTAGYDQFMLAPTTDRDLPFEDCVHVTFPQCGGVN